METNMPVRLNFLAATLVLTLGAAAVPAMAEPLPDPLLASGDNTVVTGRAHVELGGLGTYIVIRRPGSDATVAGFIPFGDKDSFPNLAEIEGQRVQIHGVVGLYGRPLITMTDPDQLEVIG